MDDDACVTSLLEWRLRREARRRALEIIRESAGWSPLMAEAPRVTKPGGRYLASDSRVQASPIAANVTRA